MGSLRGPPGLLLAPSGFSGVNFGLLTPVGAGLFLGLCCGCSKSHNPSRVAPYGTSNLVTSSFVQMVKDFGEALFELDCTIHRCLPALQNQNLKRCFCFCLLTSESFIFAVRRFRRSLFDSESVTAHHTLHLWITLLHVRPVHYFGVHHANITVFFFLLFCFLLLRLSVRKYG